MGFIFSELDNPDRTAVRNAEWAGIYRQVVRRVDTAM
jgi:hypothetical protein